MRINISLGDLEAVLVVARAGSFSAAAEALNLSQPSVSSRVRHAEEVLGVKLFHRTTRKVTITEHGRRLVIRADRTFGELQAVLQEFKDEAQLKRGRVVLGATPTISGSVLPEVIKLFTRRWPGISVILQDNFYGQALERVNSGEVDFAIAPYHKEDPRFDFELLFREELLVTAPLGHPLLAEDSVSLEAVSQHPIITMPPQASIRGNIADAFAEKGLEFEPGFQTLHQMSIISMVRAGFGVTFLPRIAIPTVNMDQLGTVPVEAPGLYRRICLTTAHGRAIQPAAETMMETVRDVLGGGPP
jgi:DNA-binding transcriptional LysR family regulator